MDKLSKSVKIISLIVSIAVIGYIFPKIVEMVKPGLGTMVFFTMYFAVIILAFTLSFASAGIVSLRKIKNNVDYNEIQGIYNELLTKHKKELDKYRVPIIIKRIIQMLCVCFIFIMAMDGDIGFTKGMSLQSIELLQRVAHISIPLFIISCVIKTKSEKMYRKLYKEKVIGALIKKVGKDLTYVADSEEKSTILNKYAKADFDVSSYNRSTVDDYITGCLDDGHPVSMANLDLKRVTGSGKNRRVTEIFGGMFVNITASKNVGAIVKILTNRNAKHSKMDVFDKKCEKLEMDSQAFEKYFNVYSDNKIIAMQIITSDILEMLTEFRKNYGIELEIAIDKNHIYLRFHTGAMFEAKTFGGSIRKKDLVTYYGVLKMITMLSKRINEAVENTNI